MSLEKSIGSLNFEWRCLINQVNAQDTWDEDVFVDLVLRSADFMRPYITETDEITVPRIVIALSGMLTEYAKASPILPGVKYQAASLNLAAEIASWLYKPESFIKEKTKNMSRETIYSVLDRYERHTLPNGELDIYFWADND